LTEGSGGEPGHFDLGMLERDYALARITSGRHTAAVILEESGEPIGVLDWLRENPTDGVPWIGLVMIRADRQRRGFATEAVEGLLAQLRLEGARTVRAAVHARNPAGRALARHLGFEPIAPAPSREAVIVERRLLPS
jgi:RimJ/RimL family protein N-acetyltransferase